MTQNANDKHFLMLKIRIQQTHEFSSVALNSFYQEFWVCCYCLNFYYFTGLQNIPLSWHNENNTKECWPQSLDSMANDFNIAESQFNKLQPTIKFLFVFPKPFFLKLSKSFFILKANNRINFL